MKSLPPIPPSWFAAGALVSGVLASLFHNDSLASDCFVFGFILWILY